MSKLSFEYRHIVGFEETNLVGNVYYVNHLRWQGRCREMFLREHSPGVLAQLSGNLVLATLRCSCEYLAELSAFDELIVRMRLFEIVQNRITLDFEYIRPTADGAEEIVARGQQQVACLVRDGRGAVPTPIPDELVQALRPYGG